MRRKTHRSWGPAMTTTLEKTSRASNADVLGDVASIGAFQPQMARPFRLWGCGPAEFHDRLWASRGVQVIRAGSGAEPASGASLYLLLGLDQLVRFPLRQAIQRMHWLNPRLLRMRLVEEAPSRYRETITGGLDGSFSGFHREYAARGQRTARAWLTGDVNLAKAWSNAASEQTGRDNLRSLARNGASIPISLPGLSARAEDDIDFDAWLASTIGPEDRIDAAFPRVFEYAPGVWLHEGADIDPGAVVIGPLWVGAGVELDSDAIEVGPGVLEDQSKPRADLPAIDWDDMRASHWSLPPLRSSDRSRLLAKRCFDIVFSLFAIAVTLPLYPIIAMSIMLEDGRPIFFCHTRQTKGGKPFPCIKFRTMVRNADAIKARLALENQADGPQFFIRDDPRLLRVGKVLRKFQIDELPQFINVLLGHMSVVGPRPSPDGENQYCPSWREARLSVRPGVTGLWQVRRTRSEDTDFQEWIKYDLQYVRHQSMWRDLNIIVETVWQIVSGVIFRREN